MALIELRDVTKSYKRDAIEIPVLDRVSITVDAGDFLGPDGAVGLRQVDAAQPARRHRPADARLDQDRRHRDQQPVGARARRWRARHIGFIFQLYNLIPVLTAFENVELPLLLTNLSKKQRRDHVMTALGIVGLARSRRSTIRVSSRAARSSASRSRAPSSPIRRCCSPTSRPATSTRSRPAKC